MTDTPRQYVLEVLSDPSFVRDIVKGILNTIFFHRYFPNIRPTVYQPSSAPQSYTSRSPETLPISLPAILEPAEIGAEIDGYVSALVGQLVPPNNSQKYLTGGGQGSAGGNMDSRGEIVVQFLDKKRRKATQSTNTNAAGVGMAWLGRFAGQKQREAETEEEVCWEEWVLSVVVARPRSETERVKVRRAMESSLQKAALKIVGVVSREKEHVPPIATSDGSPFAWRVLVNPR